MESEALKRIPEYLEESEIEDRKFFEIMVKSYISPKDKIIDLCSGIGRTKNWIYKIVSTEITCSDIDQKCLESLGKDALYIDINSSKWDIKKSADIITCYGGFNRFVNWYNLFKNVHLHSEAHIFQFNRNDTEESLTNYLLEHVCQNYHYTAYDLNFIKDLYHNIPFFTINEIISTKYSFIVYARNTQKLPVDLL